MDRGPWKPSVRLFGAAIAALVLFASSHAVSAQTEEASSEPDNLVLYQLPPNVPDSSNTQMGQVVTESEYFREAHYHSAETTFGYPLDGLPEPTLAERAADAERNAIPQDVWLSVGPQQVPPALTGPEAQSMADSTQSLASTTATQVYLQAHPDDEMSMWAWIHAYGNNTSIHKVFAVMTRGEQTGYCNYNSANMQPGEYQPNPNPGSSGIFTGNCDSARINSYFGFLSGVGARYSGIDSSYTYMGEVSMASQTPVDPCYRDNTADGGDTIPGVVGLDVAIQTANPGQARYTCTGTSLADDVRIYRGTGGYSTVLFFNLGDGDVSRNEVQWAMNLIANSQTSLMIPNRAPTHVIAPYSNATIGTCYVYLQPDHRAVHEAAYNYDITISDQLGSSCDNDIEANVERTIPTADWTALFRSPTIGTASSIHDRRYGWLQGQLWSQPYTNGRCSSSGVAGEENCLHSRIQNFWLRF